MMMTHPYLAHTPSRLLYWSTHSTNIKSPPRIPHPTTSHTVNRPLVFFGVLGFNAHGFPCLRSRCKASWDKIRWLFLSSQRVTVRVVFQDIHEFHIKCTKHLVHPQISHPTTSHTAIQQTCIHRKFIWNVKNAPYTQCEEIPGHTRYKSRIVSNPNEL